MQTKLSNKFLDTEKGQLADKILRSCVHCGFCTATCPTYQILGDELDSPRGRIYLIKQMLEDQPVSKDTLLHLDRCLTCRSCETTCPSGVKYGKLLEIGRNEVEKRVKRPLFQRLMRKTLLIILPNTQLFCLLLGVGQFFRPVLPAKLKSKIPPKIQLNEIILKKHKRKMLILDGCVQPALAPVINHATRKVLDALQIELISFSGCCGAINHHLSDEKNTVATIKNNIDRLMIHFDSGVEAIIITASGCGAMFKEYPDLLSEHPEYKDKADYISSKTFDLSEIIKTDELNSVLVKDKNKQKIAIQTPCTLQHAQKLPFSIDKLFSKCGYQLSPVMDKHLCCGSAGTYSILQNKLSRQLRQQRLSGLMQGQPDVIVTANIGCLLHLNEGSSVPVRHWIEVIAEDLKS